MVVSGMCMHTLACAFWATFSPLCTYQWWMHHNTNSTIPVTTLLQHKHCSIIIYVPLTSACCVHSNVYGLSDIQLIKYLTAVNSILSTSPPLQKYYHLISGSAEVPLVIAGRNFSSIREEPIPKGRLFATSRVLSHTEQATNTFTNILQGHKTVVPVCCTIEREPNTSTWGTQVKDLCHLVNMYTWNIYTHQ